MGANKKFDKTEVVNQLRHVLREVKYPKNVDIDKTRTHLNYSLTPERDLSAYEYLKKRLSEVQVANKRGINLMSGWVITKPKELDDNFEEAFFKACYDFLSERYGGEKNVVSCEVHKDESGEPHMHFCFVPVAEYTPNENLVKVVEYMKENSHKNNTQASKELGIDRKTVRRYRNKTDADIKYEKLSAREVINKQDLITFHSDLQKYLDKLKIPAKVKTGVTKAQGGNITVEELKKQRNYIIEHQDKLTHLMEDIEVQSIEKEMEF